MTCSWAKTEVKLLLAELQGYLHTAEDYARKEREFVSHLRKNAQVYGDATDEMIVRFTKLAEEHARKAARLGVLIVKVEAEDLPPEVMAYDPIARKPS